MAKPFVTMELRDGGVVILWKNATGKCVVEVVTKKGTTKFIKPVSVRIVHA